ncbi:MAG: aryl-sulfate sulfotransferase [Verrucomicrobia bacterium]|nr:aryl-sulfate sulfotransferase [Verrucomicrobiota bacterium]
MNKSIILAVTAWLLAAAWGLADTGEYRNLGYLYLSPSPGAEYTSPQTRFVLVRFKDVAPSVVTNLAQFIQVTGASSGIHAGLTKIASDNRTVIFQMSADFQANELVTVTLAPQTPTGAVQPYQYQFVIAHHLPDPPAVTARGENPPDGTKDHAFDGDATTKWVDLVVPNGSANFSWIQYAYPGIETHMVNQYAITSANDAPERDPKDWRFYGVTAAGGLTLLDTRTGQTFATRRQKITFFFSNTTDYRGYRLEITRVANATTASAVQVAELAFIEPTGSILREYWTGIPGTAVSALTTHANYPNNPTGSSQLASFEAPTDWAEQYGTRVRGFITAPTTGSYVFWIATDDNGELWLSTNADPANKSRIAYVPGWTSAQQWDGYTAQKSAAINLIAGQKYYIEALQKEEGGGDNLAVGWAKPGQATTAPSQVIPGWVLSPWTGGSSAPPAPAPNAVAANPAPSVDVNPIPAAPETPVKDPGGPLGTLPAAAPGKTGIMPNGVSVPSNFPHISITTNNNPDAGLIFIDNRGGSGQCFNVIFNNSGSPVWYQRMPDERRDMKVQPNGMLTMVARTGGMRFVGLNHHYEEVASYWAANGYTVDEHELHVMADGTYFLIGLRSNPVDMSRYVAGGNSSASVIEQVIQQFTPADELIFQWRSWDHLDIASQQYVVTTTNPGDFSHMNAIAVDSDGHLLLSSRNTSEVTKINRDSGEIIWRLGGTHNQFTYLNDPLAGPRNQHAIRPLGSNRYTLFDNGDGHSPQVSRAVEYELNPVTKTATVVWQYPASPTTSLYSHYMGNAQRLPNGNTLINWAVGNLPKLTEVRPDGTKAFEMNWVDQFEAYRVWRCPWQGVALKPYLILEAYPDNVTLLFNQFGDTNVAFYRIYGGTSPQPTTLLATAATTMANLTNLTNGQRYYFRVSAVDVDEVEGAYSNEESLVVNIIKPGQNMVTNGDFTAAKTAWTWTVAGTAAATWTVTGGISSFAISTSSTTVTNVQLKQTGIPLVQGKRYVFEFDAWTSSGTRTIDAKVTSASNSNYSGLGSSSISADPTKKHFRYVFTMASASDFSSQVVFNMATSTRTFFLDNVSLFNPPPGDFNEDGKVDLLDLKVMTTEWRKQQSGLTSDLNGDGKVDFKDFGMLGDNWSGSP